MRKTFDIATHPRGFLKTILFPMLRAAVLHHRYDRLAKEKEDQLMVEGGGRLRYGFQLQIRVEHGRLDGEKFRFAIWQ